MDHEDFISGMSEIIYMSREKNKEKDQQDAPQETDWTTEEQSKEAEDMARSLARMMISTIYQAALFEVDFFAPKKPEQVIEVEMELYKNQIEPKKMTREELFLFALSIGMVVEGRAKTTLAQCVDAIEEREEGE